MLTGEKLRKARKVRSIVMENGANVKFLMFDFLHLDLWK